MGILYNMGVGLGRTCFTLFAKWIVEGKECVPRWGPLIVVCNHQSNADPAVVAASMPRQVYTMAKRSLFANPVAGFVLRAWGAYPIDRNGRDLSALKWALALLEQDRAVVMFPEGTRNPGAMQAALPGITYLALKSQAPILPISITGTESIPGFLRVAMPLKRIHVRIGQPFTLPIIEGNVPRPQVDQLTEMIMRRVAALLPPRYRGVYGDLERPVRHVRKYAAK